MMFGILLGISVIVGGIFSGCAPQPVEQKNAPTVTISSPSDNLVVYSSSVWVKGTALVEGSLIKTVMIVIGAFTNTPALALPSWSNQISLAPGTNLITVVATSADGVSGQASVHIIYAVDTPVVTISAPTDNWTTNQPSVALSGTVTVSNSTIEWVKIVNAGVTNDASLTLPNWSYALTLNPGSNTITVIARSTNGVIGSGTFHAVYQVILTNKLVAFDGQANFTFGNIVAVSGDGLVFAAYSRDDTKATRAGSVYWFKKNGSGWITNKLIAYDGADSAYFGTPSLSDDGNTMLVAAPNDNDNGVASGSVYWLQKTGSSWITNKFVPADVNSNDNFGKGIDISDDGYTFIVGAFNDDDGATNTGSAYWFQKIGSVWSTNSLRQYDPHYNDQFGNGVAVSGDGTVFAVGTPGLDDKATDAGGVYLFTKDGANWITNKFVPSSSAGSQYMGRSVDISDDGNVVVAGAIQGGTGGAVYVYKKSGSVWSTNQITPSDAAATDWFGYSVSVSGDGNTILVGSPQDDDYGADSGSAYLYSWNGFIWVEEMKLNAYDGAAADKFGINVSVSDNGCVAVIGVQGDDDMGSLSGSVFVFSIYK